MAVDPRRTGIDTRHVRKEVVRELGQQLIEAGWQADDNQRPGSYSVLRDLCGPLPARRGSAIAVSVTRGADLEGRELHVGQFVLDVRPWGCWCVEENDFSEEGVHDGVLLVGGCDLIMNGERDDVRRSRHAPGVTHHTARLLSDESGA